MREVWKPIPGYEGRYEVSNFGKVKSLERIVVLPRQTNVRKEKILKGSVDEYGYLRFGLYDENIVMKPRLAHRLVLAAFIGPSDLQINHKDLNKLNNCITNLEYTTALGNSAHARQNKSNWALNNEKHPNCKISKDELVEILFMRLLGTPLKPLSIGYGIRDDYIKSLRYRTSYAAALKKAKSLL